VFKIWVYVVPVPKKTSPRLSSGSLLKLISKTA
jgi:hypothetical protein